MAYKVCKTHVDIINPPQPDQVFEYGLIAADDEDMADIQRQARATDELIWPPPIELKHTYTVTDLFGGLDKDEATQLYAVNASQIVDELFGLFGGLGPLPQDQWTFKVFQKTPRYTGWTNSDGEKHAPPPTDKGKASAKQGKVTLPATVLGQITVIAAFLRANCLATNNRNFCNAADKVDQIAKDLAAKKISESEAIAKVNVIVNSFR